MSNLTYFWTHQQLQIKITIRILTGIIFLLTMTGCSLFAKRHTPEERKQTIVEMGQIYDCVWYQYLSGNKKLADQLIQDAVQRGKSGGVEGTDILAVYSQSRSKQKERVNEKAVAIARLRAPRIETIMGININKPTEEETTQALLELYQQPCSALAATKEAG